MGNTNPSAAAAPTPPRDRDATAKYIAEISGDLVHLARNQGLDALAYILEMAKLEAENNLPSRKRG